MPLNKAALKQAILTTFETAKVQEWTSEQVAGALADAIDTFVRGADVVGVTVEVRNNAQTIIGTGTQTGTGDIQ